MNDQAEKELFRCTAFTAEIHALQGGVYCVQLWDNEVVTLASSRHHSIKASVNWLLN